MAWEAAGYALTAVIVMLGVTMIIAAIRIGSAIGRVCASFDRLGREAETTLQQCRLLAAETRTTLDDVRNQAKGLAVLADGARMLGDLLINVTKTASQLTGLWRNRLAMAVAAAAEETERSEDQHNSGA